MSYYHQTKQRQLLLEVISEVKGHINAKELFNLAASRDSSISQATVYRSLSLFKQQGLIDEKHLGQAQCVYEVKGKTQHQHLVCSKCGKVIEFGCPLNEIVERVKNEHSFIVTKAEVYFEGYCADCIDKKQGKRG
jgi:Fe2+ or Zn2+ uptake regulation protein